jgi:ATP-dependent RNA helicase DeaD
MQHASGPVVWFRADVGRRNKADPKWLLPMLCRRGKVQRTAIGAIRILDSVTEFEIAAEEAEGFATSVKRADGDDVHIERITGEAGERPPKRDFSDKPRGKPTGEGFKGKPFKGKPFKERSAASPRDERSSGDTRGFDKPAFEDRPFAKPAGKPFKGKPTGSFRDERAEDRPKSFGKPAYEDRPFGKPAGKPFKGKPSSPPREDRAEGTTKDFSKPHRKGPGGADKPQRSGPVKPGRGPDGPSTGFKKKKFKNRDA